MNQHEDLSSTEEQAEPRQPADALPPAAEAALSAAGNRQAPPSAPKENTARFASSRSAPLAHNASQESTESSGVQRAAGILRASLPVLQRLLPLIDGNVATAVGNVLAARAGRAPGKVDFAPIEDGLAELRSQQHGLRLQVTEQNISLKAVEDQLELMRQATTRNTLEQQEVLEDLKAFGTKMKILVAIALLLAAGSFGLTLALFLRIR